MNHNPVSYQRLIANVLVRTEKWPTSVRSMGRRLAMTLAQRPFFQLQFAVPSAISQVVPTSRPHLESIAECGFFLSWYFHFLDDTADGDATPTDALLGQLAQLEMFAIHNELDLAPGMIPLTLPDATHQVVDALNREIDTRFVSIEDVRTEQCEVFTTSFLRQRVAPWSALIESQATASVPRTASPIVSALKLAWENMLITRQIADDTEDWQSDIERGRINFFSSKLMTMLKESGISYGELLSNEPVEAITPFVIDNLIRLKGICHDLNNEAIATIRGVGANAFAQLAMEQEERQQCAFNSLLSNLPAQE